MINEPKLGLGFSHDDNDDDQDRNSYKILSISTNFLIVAYNSNGNSIWTEFNFQ